MHGSSRGHGSDVLAKVICRSGCDVCTARRREGHSACVGGRRAAISDRTPARRSAAADRKTADPGRDRGPFSGDEVTGALAAGGHILRMPWWTGGVGAPEAAPGLGLADRRRRGPCHFSLALFFRSL